MSVSKDTIIIGVDLMGSDASPSFIAKAFRYYFAKSKSNIFFRAYLNKKDHSSVYAALSDLSDQEKQRVQLISCNQSITMEDQPLVALRQKKNASLVTGLKDLKKGCIQALISSGNTGAIVAGSALFLSRLEGIVRPALAVSIPLHNKKIVLLDVGGSVLFSSKDLCRYALLGVMYHSYLTSNNNANLGLLNIGSEVFKGTEEHQQAFKIMSQENWSHSNLANVHFLGNIEPNQVLFSDIDVIVTDGLNGNVFLKTLEGAMCYATKHILKQNRPELNAKNYPGAIVLGVDGLVIKCHGYGSVESIVASIEMASNLIKNKFHDHQVKSAPYTLTS